MALELNGRLWEASGPIFVLYCGDVKVLLDADRQREEAHEGYIHDGDSVFLATEGDTTTANLRIRIRGRRAGLFRSHARPTARPFRNIGTNMICLVR